MTDQTPIDDTPSKIVVDMQMDEASKARIKWEQETRKAFYTALAKAQGAIEHAKKDTTNPFFNSRYADLASVWDTCRKPLTDNGIAVIQETGYNNENGCAYVVTRLTHSSGYSEDSRLDLPAGKKDAQGIGSALTYARRYALMAAVGIAPDDDDGNAAVTRKSTKSDWSEGNKNKVKPSNAKKTSARQLKQNEEWEAFLEQLHNNSTPQEVNRWWDDPHTQEALSKWPTDWQEKASDEHDNYIDSLIAKQD